MQKKYKAVLFDLDGTLLDTSLDLSGALNYALKKNGLPERTVNETKQFTGNGIRVLVKRAVPGGEMNPLYEKTFSDFKTRYSAHLLDKTVPYPGIIDVLKKLKNDGYKLAIISNKNDLLVKQIDYFYFDGKIFDVVSGTTPDVPFKPSPEMVNLALLKLGIKKEEALYVGDTNIDFDTAKNANVDVIMVSYGFKPKQFLIDYGVKDIIDSPQELIKRLEDD
ncbi:MAG: HAD-IA family hydrolase [Bacillales bacterium]|nr:HAD-IA family hydrolase [Bacillales bacterium]